MKSKLILAALLLLILLLFFLLQLSARPQSFPNVALQTPSESGEIGWYPEEFDPSFDVEGALYGLVTLDGIVAFAVYIAARARRSRPLGWRSDFITINPS